MNISPSINFSGNKEAAVLLKSEALQFYNHILSILNTGGLSFINRQKSVPSGSITVVINRLSITGNTTGYINIYGNSSVKKGFTTSNLVPIVPDIHNISYKYRFGSKSATRSLTPITGPEGIHLISPLLPTDYPPGRNYWYTPYDKETKSHKEAINWDTTSIYYKGKAFAPDGNKQIQTSCITANGLILIIYIKESDPLLYTDLYSKDFELVATSNNLSIFLENPTIWGFLADARTLYITTLSSSFDQKLIEVIFSEDYSSIISTVLFSTNTEAGYTHVDPGWIEAISASEYESFPIDVWQGGSPWWLPGTESLVTLYQNTTRYHPLDSTTLSGEVEYITDLFIDEDDVTISFTKITKDDQIYTNQPIGTIATYTYQPAYRSWLSGYVVEHWFNLTIDSTVTRGYSTGVEETVGSVSARKVNRGSLSTPGTLGDSFFSRINCSVKHMATGISQTITNSEYTSPIYPGTIVSSTITTQENNTYTDTTNNNTSHILYLNEKHNISIIEQVVATGTYSSITTEAKIILSIGGNSTTLLTTPSALTGSFNNYSKSYLRGEENKTNYKYAKSNKTLVFAFGTGGVYNRTLIIDLTTTPPTHTLLDNRYDLYSDIGATQLVPLSIQKFG